MHAGYRQIYACDYRDKFLEPSVIWPHDHVGRATDTIDAQLIAPLDDLVAQIPDQAWTVAWNVNSQGVGSAEATLKYLTP